MSRSRYTIGTLMNPVKPVQTLMLTITSALALFLLLIVSSVVFFISKRIRLPYTVLLVLVGILLVPLVQLPWLQPTFGFITDLVLTPELLFYVFLPMLIFESAFNMNMRRMIESGWSIMLLSVVGLLLSTILIAGGLYFLLPLVGLPIPFIVALLFGAIISSIDPVAVLALFKEAGAPKRLSLIFEGESLFNDGTAVALFLVLLGVVQHGFHGGSTIIEGAGVFGMMLLLGVVFGILMAAVFSRVLRYTRSNEFVTVTMLIVSAHIVFILSELINSHEIFGLHLHLSAIIATTVSSLFLGNYARHSLSPRSDEYLGKSIEHLAFVANSLVFLMAGILFASTDIDVSELLVPILIAISVVATARAISVYAVILPLNRLKLESTIPASWQKLLAWGSLRGALAIIVVLLVPDNLAVAGWQHSFTPKELLLGLTIGCILATLFIKAPTIGPLIERLGISKPSPFQQAYQTELGLYYLQTELTRISSQKDRGFLHEAHYAGLTDKVRHAIDQTLQERQSLRTKHGQKLFKQTLLHIALDIEIRYLKELYSHDEVDEAVYRKIKGKLNLQKEMIERDEYEAMDPSLYTDRKDVFDRMVRLVHSVNRRRQHSNPIEEKYLYYRAQSIIARKAIKTLTQMQTQYGEPVFDATAFDSVITSYEKHLDSAGRKAEEVYRKHPDQLADLMTDLAGKVLRSTGDKALLFMDRHGLASEADIERIAHRYS